MEEKSAADLVAELAGMAPGGPNVRKVDGKWERRYTFRGSWCYGKACAYIYGSGHCYLKSTESVWAGSLNEAAKLFLDKTLHFDNTSSFTIEAPSGEVWTKKPLTRKLVDARGEVWVNLD